MVQAKQAEAAGLKVRPHSAKGTLTFLHKHFVKENFDQFIIKWMLILRHARDPGVGIYEWCNSFGPLIRAYLRTADEDYLGDKELHRVNTCITDKWKPITLADGAFDRDELKRDISASDAKFAVRKYKPTALILEYLTSRATRQQVPLPSFMMLKPSTDRKKRSTEEKAGRLVKRFNRGAEGIGHFTLRIRTQKRTLLKMNSKMRTGRMIRSVVLQVNRIGTP